MNYYEHHLGDYAKDAGHLTLTEEGAYRRLLDVYYIRERPLPVDFDECCKLARARSKAERDAVECVLQEFFELSQDGHHQARADAEIARFHESKPEREARRENDRERQRRARERRRTLFESLRAAGIVPSFYATTTELEGLLSRATSQTRPAGVTRDNTATQSPDTRHHKKKENPPAAPVPRSTKGSRIPPDWQPGESGMAFAASKGLTNGQAANTLEKFRDHWTAASGQKASKADWQAAWRTWVRNEVEFSGKRQPPAHDPFRGSI